MSGEPLRLAVFTDYPYRADSSGVYGGRAFVLFMAGLAAWSDPLVILGRLEPQPGRWHYRLDDAVRFVPLAHTPSLADMRASLAAVARSMPAVWRALDGVDVVWLLGPFPLSIAFAAVAAARRRRLVLGVRQDLPRYVRARHPGRRRLQIAAALLEGSYRLLALRCPTVVVGPELARRYRHARRLLPIAVSLVPARDVVAPADALARAYDGELRVLSVGRLEREKNPLLLADILSRLHAIDPRWRLIVCGEGPLRDHLRRRLARLGVADRAELRGYVPIDRGLAELYRSSHAVLHVSRTEGVPQVIYEAFAAGAPLVATAVGGVPEAVGDAGLLVRPGDAAGAARALGSLAADAELRRRLIESGLARMREHTLERESARLARFLSRDEARPPRERGTRRAA